MAMNFETFKQIYAETMMYYQFVENDIKFIFAFMLKGDVDQHLGKIEKKTLGNMIKKLEELDNSDGNPYISSEDYEFLTMICENRNRWAHQTFTNFAYITNWQYSKEYEIECNDLRKDCERVKRASDILEKMRIEYCSNARG